MDSSLILIIIIIVLFLLKILILLSLLLITIVIRGFGHLITIVINSSDKRIRRFNKKARPDESFLTAGFY
jgi:hypothetical protein